MFHGNNIHFSPLDNKPLCSYSSKLCRQRRLNGYAFCIRHILEDKSAPFKQCGFVTRTNYQKCLNAIPSNQERGYCHSHMQVAGLTPKTERKSKVTNNLASGGSGGKNGNGNSNNGNNNNNGSGVTSPSSSSASSSSVSQSQSTKSSSSNPSSGVSAGQKQGGSGNGNKIKSEESGQNQNKELINFSNSTSKSGLNNNNSSNTNNSSNHSSSSSKTTPTHKGKSYLAASNISGLKKCTDATSLICGKHGSKNNGSLTNNLNEPPTKSNNSSSCKNITSVNTKVNSNSSTSSNQILTESQSSPAPPAVSVVKKEPQRKMTNANSKLTSGESIASSQNQNQNTVGNLKKKIHPAPSVKSASGVDKSALNNSNKNNVHNGTNNSISNSNTSTPTNTTITTTTSPSSPTSTGNPVSTLCVRDRWKSFKFLPQDSEDMDIKPARQLEQMKTIKILEKLPLFAEVCSNTNATNKSDIKKLESGNRNGISKSSHANTIPISSGIEILLGPPFLSKTKLFSINKSNKANVSKSENGWRKSVNSGGVTSMDGNGDAVENSDGKCCEIQIQIPNSNNNKRLKVQVQDDDENKTNGEQEVDVDGHDLLHPWEWESRKQFLKRVRTAFKRQYKTIRKACKLSEEQDKSEKGFRDALLTCAMSDSSLCAQILSTGDSKLDEICTVLLTSRKIASEDQNSGVNLSVSSNHQQARVPTSSRSITKIQNKGRTNAGVSISVSSNTSNNNSSSKVASIKISGSGIGGESSRTNNGTVSRNVKTTTLNGGLSLDDKSCIDLSLTDSKDTFHNDMGSSGSSKSSNLNSSFKLNSGGNCMWNNIDVEPKKGKVIKKTALKANELSNATHTSCSKSVGSLNGCRSGGSGSGSGNGIGGRETNVPKKKAKKTKALSSPSSLSTTMKTNVKKRKVDSVSKVEVEVVNVSDLAFNGDSSNAQLNATNTLVLHSDDSQNHSNHNLNQDQSNLNHNHLLQDTLNLSSHEQLLGVSSSVDLEAVANLETVLNSVSSSSDAATTPEGVITDASFDSPFDHSTSSHPDCEFSDDDLEKSFELQIDPEIAHQASRLLEDNGLTEDDFNELFPETRMGDHKLIGRADLTDLGIDFTSNFDANDIDYSLFANIFPNFRTNQPESISVSHQF